MVEGWLKMFRDRVDAGIRLSELLGEYGGKDVVVLGIPRGGVIVANEVAKRLNSQLDIIIPKKIPAPWNPELAIGAVTEDGSTVLDREMVQSFGISDEYIESAKMRQMEEIKRRGGIYSHRKIPLTGKIVVLVDDGIATGATMHAAIKSVRRDDPGEIVVAVPVGPQDTIEDMKQEVDRVVCISNPAYFGAVGSFYQIFDQTTDKEVMEVLKKNG